MADIQLIDFPAGIADRICELLETSGLDISRSQSRHSGGTADLVPDTDAVIHAFCLDVPEASPRGLHASDSEAFAGRAKTAVTLIFLRQAHSDQLANLTGLTRIALVPNPHIGPNTVSVTVTDKSGIPLSRHQASLDTKVVVPDPPAGVGRTFRAIARHRGSGENGSVAFDRMKDGRGFIVYPFFGEATANALVDVLLDVLPAVAPDLLPKQRAETWVDEPALWLGAYATERERLEEAERRWLEERARLDEAIAAARTEQDRFMPLITGDGDELKDAVMSALSLFGIGVEDADKKELGGRGPQEDLWLWSGPPGDPEKDPFTLAEVKGTVRSFTEDHVGTLARYKARRMKALRNHGIRGMFIGNARRNVAPTKRPAPFQAQMIEDASREGDLLVSGWDLFQAVREVVAGRLSPEEMRRSLLEQTGRYSLPTELPDATAATAPPEATERGNKT